MKLYNYFEYNYFLNLKFQKENIIFFFLTNNFQQNKVVEGSKIKIKYLITSLKG